MTNVLIVDDERMVQELFSHYIAGAGDRYRLVGAIKGAGNAEVACMSANVDLILMDVCTADNESGLAAAAAVKKHFPRTKIIIVTSAPEVTFIKKARAAGAESFWYKEAGSAELLDVMDRTVAGESVYPDSTPRVTVGLAESTDFTPTELRVLGYIVQGLSIGEIAERMGVDYETTRTHIKNLKDKTGAGSITALAALAAGSRLVLPDY
jgi:DNA-binding NarL/FixJ family response regulator